MNKNSGETEREAQRNVPAKACLCSSVGVEVEGSTPWKLLTGGEKRNVRTKDRKRCTNVLDEFKVPVIKLHVSHHPRPATENDTH